MGEVVPFNRAKPISEIVTSKEVTGEKAAIIELPKKDDLPLMKYECECGCDKWLLCSDGVAECSECGGISDVITLNINLD